MIVTHAHTLTRMLPGVRSSNHGSEGVAAAAAAGAADAQQQEMPLGEAVELAGEWRGREEGPGVSVSNQPFSIFLPSLSGYSRIHPNLSS